MGTFAKAKGTTQMECVVDEKRRLQNCNFVKMVLMLMVVLCHSVSFWGGTGFEHSLQLRLFLS